MMRLPESIRGRVGGWLRMWGVDRLSPVVDIDYSDRIQSAWGRTRVDKCRVRLNPALQDKGDEFLVEVLCHELAHIAAYERFGSSVKPHGKEWAALVKQAGFEPRVRFGMENGDVESQVLRFEHFCPVCQSARRARRAMTHWRCSQCIAAGLNGELIIRKMDKE